MSSPPPKSLVSATTSPTVWPPSNPSGTVVPFPLPWGQTGCCPPGGMDALMKCYCDLQQASAFIGQVMLDQIKNNPAIIAAIIAGIENSGSSLPTLGVTNGSDAQPGQVGQWSVTTVNFPYSAGTQNQSVNMGVLQPGDWDIWADLNTEQAVTAVQFRLNPLPAGVEGGDLPGYFYSTSDANNALIVSVTNRALISVPTLFVFDVATISTVGGTAQMQFYARRRR